MTGETAPARERTPPGASRARTLATAAALWSLSACAEAAPPPLTVEVRALWLRGSETERADMDRFFECLLHGSDLAAYFQGDATLRYGGSLVVTPPATRIAIHDAPGYVADLRRSGELPPAGDPAATTVDLIFGDSAALGPDGCAQFTTTRVGGRDAGVAIVRTAPVCWPGTQPLRNETQLAMHELVEVVDVLLGYAGCAADGACQGDFGCEVGCDAFIGLACPGAPTATPTGCGRQTLDGWVVQRLSHEGRDQDNCYRCTTCDFAPTSRSRP